MHLNKTNEAKYYMFMCKKMKEALNDGKNIEAEYCAMHSLMIFEKIGTINPYGEIANYDLNISKEDYEKVIELCENHQKRYLRYKRMNLLKMLGSILILFLFLLFGIKVDVRMAISVSITLFVICVFENGKNESENFKKWQVNLFQNNVSKELLEYNNLHLCGL